jgi:RNA polymerase sigma-70 factor (ECF subfamily)
MADRMTTPADLNVLSGPIRDARDQFIAATEPHRPELWRFCLHLTGSPWDAEDLVQETMLKAFVRLGGLWQPVQDHRAYLFRVASNTWIDGLRHAGRRIQADSTIDESVPDTSTADADLPFEVTDAMAALIRHLPPRQRVALLLADVFGYPAAEIAAMLGVTAGAVKAMLHRARTTLSAVRTEPMPDAPRPVAADDDVLLRRFVDAFNRRDADALVALLHADASADIVGVAEEFGREVIRAQSLAEAMASSVRYVAEAGEVEGERVVLVHTEQPGGSLALTWIIRLEIGAGQILRWVSYYFTPELLTHVASLRGVPVTTHGYRYVGG